MTFQGDPYRTLGIPPGASLNEIRSAYRRLAKQYHPDAAGERALPRFLAIQAAYERLVDSEGRLRRAGSAGSPGPGAGRAGPADERWRADPARARASRDAWRARRSAGAHAAGTTGTGTGTGTGTKASPGPKAGPGTKAGPSARRGTGAGGDGAAAGPRPGDSSAKRGTGEGRSERHGRRGFRAATPGSTTYDEAAGAPLDPEWDGGAWYGPSSGTYWTLNPREYADPRKHGPEYLARARRDARPPGAAGPGDAPGRAGDPVPAPEPSAETGATGDPGRWRWSGPGPTTTDGGEAEWGTRAWTYDAGARSGPAWSPGTTGRRGPRPLSRDGAAEAPPLPDLEALARRAAPRRLLAVARRPDLRRRLPVALIAWPPLGYAAGTLLATLTGCATFSAACPEPLPLLPLAAQPLVVATLLLLPPLAAAGAFASLVALAVAIPGAAVLSVGSLPEQQAGAGVLGILVAATYLVALAGGLVSVWRDGPGTANRSP